MQKYIYNPKTLQFEKVPNEKIVNILQIILVIILLIMTFYWTRLFTKIEIQANFHKDTIYLQDKPLTKPTTLEIYSYLKEIGVKYPKVVLAQIFEESSDKGELFNSRICLENNNYLGMFHSDRGYSLSKYGKYAKFSTWQECLHDYKELQYKYYWKAKSTEEYLNILQKVYAENKKYKANLLKHLQTINKFY